MGPIKDFLEIIKLARPQAYRNLVLFPILAPESGDPDYLTLEEALRQEAVVITEVSEGGHVPELKLVNRSDFKVLILDGEELLGAKQNRIVNATFLIAPHSEVVIPVSCVEHGRWSYRSRRFDSGEKIMHFSLRREHQREVSKNLRQEKSFRSNQGMIWDEMADKAERMKVSAPTGAMEDLFEQQKGRLSEYLKAFTQVDCQVGVIMAVNGEIAGIELFWYHKTLRAFFGKLVESYALDAALPVFEGESLSIYKTVSSQCTRALGLTTDEFVSKVKSGRIIDHLQRKFPDRVALIRRELMDSRLKGR